MRSFQIPQWLIRVVMVVVGIALLAILIRPFWYFEVINNDEVGIGIQAGQIHSIKQPGIAYDLGLFVQLIKIKGPNRRSISLSRYAKMEAHMRAKDVMSTYIKTH